jgi:predicted nucleotidyltransferase
MSDMIASRHAERERLIEVARVYARTLAERIPVRAVVLAGSVARGDFNVWSDVDVLVVADDLPERLPDRLALLAADAPGGIQVVGLTPAELLRAAQRGNRLVLDAAAHGILLAGDASGLESAGAAPTASRPQNRA